MTEGADARAGPRVGRYLIYGLLDPRDNTLKYIGKTHKRREVRLLEHLKHAREGRSSPVATWVRELLAAGMQPRIFVLERVSADRDWREAEIAMIARWRQWPDERLPYVHPPQTKKSLSVEVRGVALLNVQDGG